MSAPTTTYVQPAGISHIDFLVCRKWCDIVKRALAGEGPYPTSKAPRTYGQFFAANLDAPTAAEGNRLWSSHRRGSSQRARRVREDQLPAISSQPRMVSEEFVTAIMRNQHESMANITTMVTALSRPPMPMPSPAPPPVVARPSGPPRRPRQPPPYRPVRFRPPAHTVPADGGRDERRRARRDTPYPELDPSTPRAARENETRDESPKDDSRAGSRSPAGARTPPTYMPNSPMYPGSVYGSEHDAVMREATAPLESSARVAAETPLFTPGSPDLPPQDSSFAPHNAQMSAPFDAEVFAWQPGEVHTAFPAQTRVSPTETHSPLYIPNQTPIPSLPVASDPYLNPFVGQGDVDSYLLDDPTLLIGTDVFN